VHLAGRGGARQHRATRLPHKLKLSASRESLVGAKDGGSARAGGPRGHHGIGQRVRMCAVAQGGAGGRTVRWQAAGGARRSLRGAGRPRWGRECIFANRSALQGDRRGAPVNPLRSSGPCCKVAWVSAQVLVRLSYAPRAGARARRRWRRWRLDLGLEVGANARKPRGTEHRKQRQARWRSANSQTHR